MKSILFTADSVRRSQTFAIMDFLKALLLITPVLFVTGRSNLVENVTTAGLPISIDKHSTSRPVTGGHIPQGLICLEIELKFLYNNIEWTCKIKSVCDHLGTFKDDQETKELCRQCCLKNRPIVNPTNKTQRGENKHLTLYTTCISK